MFGQDFDDTSPTSDADIPHTQSATGPERRDKCKQISYICKSGLKLGRVISEFKIAVSHWPFSGQNWQYVKIFGSFSLITPNHTNYIKWPYTFVHGQTLVEVWYSSI